jgi:hypothetical protein
MRLPATRGRLRVYLGVAPGAGATCALLSEGRRRAEQGADVVVAGVQTGGRPFTFGAIPPVANDTEGCPRLSAIPAQIRIGPLPMSAHVS